MSERSGYALERRKGRVPDPNTAYIIRALMRHDGISGHLSVCIRECCGEDRGASADSIFPEGKLYEEASIAESGTAE